MLIIKINHQLIIKDQLLKDLNSLRVNAGNTYREVRFIQRSLLKKKMDK